MISTLIVPGLDGSGPGHWQRLWADRDPAAELVEQDDWSEPVLAEWLHRLEAKIAETPHCVLVAHSLGCVLVAHLAKGPAAAHVSGALLVAPADIDRLSARRPSLKGFVFGPPTALPFPTILAASRNDPFMDWRSAERHANGWGSALVDLGNAGHVNPDSGFGAWPDAEILADGLRGTLPVSMRVDVGAGRTSRRPSPGPRPSPAASAGTRLRELRQGPLDRRVG